MDHSKPPPIIGILSAAVCAGLVAACAGGPSPATVAAPTTGTGPTTSFAYGVPSPPTALFHIEDSLVVEVSTAAADFEVTTKTLLTMNMVFARDPAGVGVVGSVVGFNVVSTNALAGTRVAGADQISGPLAMVVSRQGHVEVGAMPALDSAVADLTPFPGIAFDMFPRLPGYPVGLGGMWVDTVGWSVTDETSESATQTVFTYTIVGDTLVDGRTLLNIAVEGEVSMQMIEGVGDALSDQRLTGTATGYVLWDPEQNLPKHSAMHRQLEGTNQVPGAGTIRMRIGGVVRVLAAY
ncbi:MAG: hypothetical protein OXF01_14005 [Gemmatimonadetes bacterium]|nr:hypothetical protein [Gemmatimonadota bacterium]